MASLDGTAGGELTGSVVVSLRLQRRGVRQRTAREALLLRLRPIFANRLATDLQVPSDLLIGLAQLHSSNQLTNVQHVRSPPCQVASRWSKQTGVLGAEENGKR
jgi:hypothetical protein